MISPNGSCVIVYGHEQGLHILWRGGKPLKQVPGHQEAKPKTNGTINDEIMILDSGEEQEAAKPTKTYTDHPIFQDEEEEFDALRPYDSIIQELDLSLGVEVLHLSFPHLPSELHRTTLESLPKLLTTSIIVAAACSDSTVRIISIPITPPSPQSKARPEMRTGFTVPHTGRGHFGEQMVVIPSVADYQSISRGVSITLTSQIVQGLENVYVADVYRDNPRTQSRNSSRSPTRSRSRPANRDQSWEFLLASHSDDLSGLLLIYRIPFTGDVLGNGSRTREPIIPWQIQNLASPAISVNFNPSLFPAPRHSLLTVAESRGAVRVFNCKPHSDSNQGSWVFSLYPGFQTSLDRIARRKEILCAQWVLGGKAIVVLLADGEWGVWDLEHAGPKVNGDVQSASLGGISLAFAISGWIGSSPVSKSLVKISSGRKENTSKLTPMTPGTRKARQAALFSGSTTTANAQTVGLSRGGLFVTIVHNSSNSKVDDESLLLWYEDSITVIPSLFTHWQNKSKGSGNLFGAGVSGQPQEYNNIQLGGEVRNGISIIPKLHQNHRPKADTDAMSEILVTGEHRLIIAGPPRKPWVPATTVPPQSLSKFTDQHLLTRGELDVDGMERILSRMSNGHSGDYRNGTTPKRKVDFLSL